ncbi:MAG: hypothetical protein J5663_00555 [Bacteroidaceae bacterium]|nr:hypothetical protein [Bacteroidaceae bacterium]
MRKTIMRITMLLVMLVGITTMSYAQQISKEQLKELLRANAVDISSFTSEDFMKQMAGYGRPNTQNEQAEQRMKKLKVYMDGPFYDDCSDAMFPFYSKYVTEADYKYLLGAYKSPEGVELVQKNNKLMTSFFPALMNYIQSDVPDKMQKAMNGSKVAPLKYKGSKEFKAKWDVMMVESGTEQIVNAIMDNITRQIESVAKEENPDKAARVKDFVKIIIDDVFVVVCNVADDVYTAKDLDFSIRLLQSEAGQHLKAGNAEMIANFVPMSQALTAKVAEAVK